MNFKNNGKFHTFLHSHVKVKHIEFTLLDEIYKLKQTDNKNNPEYIKINVFKYYINNTIKYLKILNRRDFFGMNDEEIKRKCQFFLWNVLNNTLIRLEKEKLIELKHNEDKSNPSLQLTKKGRSRLKGLPIGLSDSSE